MSRYFSKQQRQRYMMYGCDGNDLKYFVIKGNDHKTATYDIDINQETELSLLVTVTILRF